MSVCLSDYVLCSSICLYFSLFHIFPPWPHFLWYWPRLLLHGICWCSLASAYPMTSSPSEAVCTPLLISTNPELVEMTGDVQWPFTYNKMYHQHQLVVWISSVYQTPGLSGLRVFIYLFYFITFIFVWSLPCPSGCLSVSVYLSCVFLGPVWMKDTRSGTAVEYNPTAGLWCPLRLLFWKGQTVILKGPCLYKQKTGSDDSGAAVWLPWETTRNRAGCGLAMVHYGQIHVLYSQIHVLQVF